MTELPDLVDLKAWKQKFVLFQPKASLRILRAYCFIPPGLAEIPLAVG